MTAVGHRLYLQQSIPCTALAFQITRGLAESPAVALLGGRKVGKTTFSTNRRIMGRPRHHLRP